MKEKEKIKGKIKRKRKEKGKKKSQKGGKWAILAQKKKRKGTVNVREERKLEKVE